MTSFHNCVFYDKEKNRNVSHYHVVKLFYFFFEYRSRAPISCGVLSILGNLFRESWKSDIKGSNYFVYQPLKPSAVPPISSLASGMTTFLIFFMLSTLISAGEVVGSF